MNQPILIWGTGAIGGVLAAYWARAGQPVRAVDIVAEHVAAMREGGLHIEGPVEEFTQRLDAVTPDEVTGTYDRIVLAVKAHHTEAALEQLLPHLAPGGFILSAQNGLNERVIAARAGAERTMGCFVNFGADWLEPGRVLYGNRAAVAVGELDGSTTPRLQEMHALLRIVEPEAVMTDNIWGYLWGKMGYGALLFATALTHDSMSDSLARTAHYPVFRALGQEVMALAAAQGITPVGFNGFDPAAFAPGAPEAAMQASVAAMVAHNRKTAKTHSGIWRDLAVRKRKTEVDAQIAPMVTIGRDLGVPVPVLSRLVDLIHEIEDGRREQSVGALDALVPACA
ncbi:2-dehydropantoate 2-reductase N-terminal domain-containing protein [Pararhodobacter sp. SW119]|uniref:ketopantoate reductase family protein n=1 Tax=Pararhodobacter sp. SW119 TaxID=2780075 RepID=UPI001ADF4E6C|nr:2-dehydropantoate 2-reductase N-terminal domain-containing protein [Pararhodobacter sp. SW119]